MEASHQRCKRELLIFLLEENQDVRHQQHLHIYTQQTLVGCGAESPARRTGVVGGANGAVLAGSSAHSTFHSGALNLPEERPLMEELPPEQLSCSEGASASDLRLGSWVEAGLDLLQPPGPVQLQHLLVHGADQLLQEAQGPLQRLRLLVAWMQTGDTRS